MCIFTFLYIIFNWYMPTLVFSREPNRLSWFTLTGFLDLVHCVRRVRVHFEDTGGRCRVMQRFRIRVRGSLWTDEAHFSLTGVWVCEIPRSVASHTDLGLTLSHQSSQPFGNPLYLGVLHSIRSRTLSRETGTWR